MPQLNPTPWFPIMITFWLIMFTFMMPKLLHTHPTNQPKPHYYENLKMYWTWPWQ